MSQSTVWLETLELNGSIDVEGLSPDQGVELEKRMYESALLSAKEGYRRLSELKVPASRRVDYLAEMLKDDRQMTKIRTKLVTAQQRIEVVESRKKKQAQRKFSKQLKAAKIEQRKQKKTEEKLSKTTSKAIDKRETLNGHKGSGKPNKHPKKNMMSRPSKAGFSKPKKGRSFSAKSSKKAGFVKKGGKSRG